MVKLEWGLKRACQGCSARFYDLGKSPIICPKCSTTFEIQTSTRTRRTKAAVVEEKATNIDIALIDVIDVPVDIEEETDALLEDAEDLGEGLDDMADVLEHADEAEDR